MEYKFEKLACNNSNLTTELLNKNATDGWRPLHFFEMGSTVLGVIFERMGPVNQEPPKQAPVWSQQGPAVEKRGPGRPKKVAMED